MKETVSTYGLAAVGLAKGAWEVYIRPEPAKCMWLAIGASVLAYDLLAPEGQSLTAEAQRHKVATALGVFVTGAHLLDKLPRAVDPFVISANQFQRKQA